MIATSAIWKAVAAELNQEGVTWALSFTATRKRQAKWSLVELGRTDGPDVQCAVLLGPVKTEPQNRGGDVLTVDVDVIFARKSKADDLASADEVLSLGDQVLQRFRAARLEIDGETVRCTGRRFATADETAIDERLLAYEGVDLIAVRLEWTVLG